MKKVLLLASIAFATTGFAQKVSNKLTFPKGHQLEMVTNVNSTVSQEAMGQSMDTKLNATVTRVFNVQNATASNATIEHKVKRIQMNIESPMGGAQSFDSDSTKDMQSEAGKGVDKTLKSKYTMTVDKNGKVLDVKADTAAKSNSEASADMVTNVLSQIIEGIDAPKVGDKSEFAILPDREVAKGESWTDSTKNGGMATYTIADINDTAIIVNFTSNNSVERKQEVMGQEITITSKDTTSGKIILDRKTGIVKETNSTTNSDGQMEVMGQTMPMNTKTIRTVVMRGI
jgi:hypothetical protein